MMKILLTGSDGQLGYELQRSLPDNYTLVAVDRDQLDITDFEQVRLFIGKVLPDVVINAAAYTAVDKAEEEPKLAWQVNETGAKNLALAVKENQAVKPMRMIQISTDFVFSDVLSRPYRPDDATAPVSVYGASKQAGDEAVLSVLADQALIIRTAWLYSAQGNNFVKTMLRLMQERDSLGIISDQVGTPTWGATLAGCIWQLLALEAQGIYHCADNGVASWYDFAVAIQEEGLQSGLLSKPTVIKPLCTADYPTAATRPVYSVMDKSKTEQTLQRVLPHWRVSLRNMLQEMCE